MKIDQFDLVEGWSLVPTPLGKDSDPEINKIKSGFVALAHLGVEDGASVEVYEHRSKGTFIVSLWGESYGRDILVTNLPSLLELLPKFCAIASAASVRLLSDRIDDLHELMIGEGGPLLKAHQLRRRKEESERHARRRESKKSAAKS